MWYDPDFSLTHLNFSQLKPKTPYLLLYWLKTQKPFSEEEVRNVLRLLAVQERDAVFDSERGFVSFRPLSASHQLVLRNLALNTHYSFALYEQEELEESLAKLLAPSPVVSDSFLSLTFANEQLFNRPNSDYQVTYRASGWRSKENQSSFFGYLFQPFWWVFRLTARLLFLDRIFTFFAPQKQLVESSQSDPLGRSFVPKTPEGLAFPSLKEF